jgi:glutamate-1-semialdehyde 2,1-aminomutase
VVASAGKSAFDPLGAAFAAAAHRFAERRPRSASLHQQALASQPGGNTRTVLYHPPFPVRFNGGEGARLTDVDGIEYVDFLGEYSAGLYGHSHPRIHAAIGEALATGLNLGGHHLAEQSFAALVCARFGMDKVRFTNSGTEANMMALGAARAFTGRSRILGFNGCYHGGLLTIAGGGSPINAPFDLLVGRYNDVEGTRRLLQEAGPSLAAVIVEPLWGTGCIPGDPPFLEMLITEGRRYGFIVIFDEVMTSRLHPQGLSAALGLAPDMKTLGKYVGGGMSFGAFGGREEIMVLFDPANAGALPHAGTYNNNTLTMIAGRASLEEIFTPEACIALNARGDRLRNRIDAMFERHGLAMRATGRGSMITIHPVSGELRSPEDADRADPRLRDLLFLDLLERGFYLARRGYMALNLILTDADCDALFDALEDVALERRTLLAG